MHELYIKNKYAEMFVSNDTCENICIFDEELQEYIYFYKLSSGSYLYEGHFDEFDEYSCFATLYDMKLVVNEHSSQELMQNQLKEKYENKFTFEKGCTQIAIYDEEFDVYVIFEWLVNKYLYEGTVNNPGYACIGVADFETMTISIESHSDFETSVEDLEDLLFSVTEGVTCELIDVYIDTEEFYAIFQRRDDGWYEYIGYSYALTNCKGTIDFDTSEIIILNHNHVD
jgi:hypothetical protein